MVSSSPAVVSVSPDVSVSARGFVVWSVTKRFNDASSNGGKAVGTSSESIGRVGSTEVSVAGTGANSVVVFDVVSSEFDVALFALASGEIGYVAGLDEPSDSSVFLPVCR